MTPNEYRRLSWYIFLAVKPILSQLNSEIRNVEMETLESRTITTEIEVVKKIRTLPITIQQCNEFLFDRNFFPTIRYALDSLEVLEKFSLPYTFDELKVFWESLHYPEELIVAEDFNLEHFDGINIKDLIVYEYINAIDYCIDLHSGTKLVEEINRIYAYVAKKTRFMLNSFFLRGHLGNND